MDGLKEVAILPAKNEQEDQDTGQQMRNPSEYR
jgi:hypothetical protein